ncbi:MAG TPA: prepilin-type N-terminal cleavage/methylation domain-containing protein [Pyrinomonadaceae bacterium]|nr:prepilin-type N-terminal cleavage/methylation domain-containing protein [Pyrinomonadaceae bacterium]
MKSKKKKTYLSAATSKQRQPQRQRREKGKTGTKNREGGFSLVEVIIAMIILLVALLGVFLTFTYAVNYNAGNNSRAQALSILQQEVELLRSAKFTPGVTDEVLKGGTKTPKIITSADNSRFRVQIVVDDDPSTPNDVDVDTTKTLKEITVTVTSESPTPGWQTAVPATVFLRRVRSN